MTAHVVVLPHIWNKVVGGGKVVIRLAEVLQELGYETTLEFADGKKPNWLEIKVPIKSVPTADLVIVSEVALGWIGKVKGFNVVYYQSPSHMDRDDNFRLIPYKEQGANAVIYNSEWNRVRCTEGGYEVGPVVHPTVDFELFHPGNKIDFNKGVYFPRKNSGMSTKALEVLKQRNVPIDWFRADEVSEGALAEIWRTCGITMMTGYPESFPMIPLEAMASGSVPIGTTGGAGHEYMKDGYNSLIVDDGDWEALAATIERGYNDQVLLQQLRENGIQTAQKYTAENQKNELVKALKEIGAPTPF